MNNNIEKCLICGNKKLKNDSSCNYCESITVKKVTESLPLKTEKFSWLGGKYKGELKAGKPHGKGSILLPNGTKYSGYWKEGKPNGLGKVLYPSGGVYEGEVLNGKRNGRGRYSYPDGRIFFGEWKDDKFIRSFREKEDTLQERSHTSFKAEQQELYKKNERKQNHNATNALWKQWWFMLLCLFLLIILVQIFINSIESLLTYIWVFGLIGLAIILPILTVNYVLGKANKVAGIILIMSTIFLIIGFFYSDITLFGLGEKDASSASVTEILAVGLNPLSSKNMEEIVGDIKETKNSGRVISNIEFADFGKRWNELSRDQHSLMVREWDINYNDSHISFSAGGLLDDSVTQSTGPYLDSLIGLVEYDTNSIIMVTMLWLSEKPLELNLYNIYYLLYATNDNFKTIDDAIGFAHSELRELLEVIRDEELEEISITIEGVTYILSSRSQHAGFFHISALPQD